MYYPFHDTKLEMFRELTSYPCHDTKLEMKLDTNELQESPVYRCQNTVQSVEICENIYLFLRMVNMLCIFNIKIDSPQKCGSHP